MESSTVALPCKIKKTVLPRHFFTQVIEPKTKKILIVTYEQYPSYIGLSTRVKGLSSAIKEQNWEVSIAAPSYHSRQITEENYDGATVFRVPVPDVFKVVKIPMLGRVCFTVIFTILFVRHFWNHSFAFDYIQSEQIYPLFGCFLLAKKKRAGLIFDDPSIMKNFIHEKISIKAVSDILGKICDWGESLAAKLPTYIFCSSKNMVDHYQRLSPKTKAAILLVPNCVNGDFLNSQSAPSANPGTIFFNCSLPYYQNVAALRNIVTVVRILERDPFSDYTMKIVLNDASLLPKEIADYFARTTRVTILSKVPDLKKVMDTAGFIILPFEKGHFSTGGIRLKALEALASGKLVLSTKEGVDGIGEIEDAVHYTCCNDPVDMAEKLKQLFRDREFALREINRMGKKARELVVEKYSWNGIGKLFNVLK